MRVARGIEKLSQGAGKVLTNLNIKSTAKYGYRILLTQNRTLGHRAPSPPSLPQLLLASSHRPLSSS